MKTYQVYLRSEIEKEYSFTYEENCNLSFLYNHHSNGEITKITKGYISLGKKLFDDVYKNLWKLFPEEDEILVYWD